MKYIKRANVILGFCPFKFFQSGYIKEKLATVMEEVVLIVNDDSDKMPPLIFVTANSQIHLTFTQFTW